MAGRAFPVVEPGTQKSRLEAQFGFAGGGVYQRRASRQLRYCILRITFRNRCAFCSSGRQKNDAMSRPICLHCVALRLPMGGIAPCGFFVFSLRGLAPTYNIWSFQNMRPNVRPAREKAAQSNALYNAKQTPLHAAAGPDDHRTSPPSANLV